TITGGSAFRSDFRPIESSSRDGLLSAKFALFCSTFCGDDADPRTAALDYCKISITKAADVIR
ncbi:hypothetical protein QIH26_28250, partial [Klebsiella pneumoniae]|nr:hypothetical protein [Klebsiella pneumoniae]